MVVIQFVKSLFVLFPHSLSLNLCKLFVVATMLLH